MPQARHGVSGVCAFAAAGSKLEGTGLEKVHIVQTQVAVDMVGGSGGGLYALSGRGGVSELLKGVPAPLATLEWRDARLDCRGKKVTLAEDLRKPA